VGVQHQVRAQNVSVLVVGLLSGVLPS
jgi:hypothetical protein